MSLRRTLEAITKAKPWLRLPAAMEAHCIPPVHTARIHTTLTCRPRHPWPYLPPEHNLTESLSENWKSPVQGLNYINCQRPHIKPVLIMTLILKEAGGGIVRSVLKLLMISVGVCPGWKHNPTTVGEMEKKRKNTYQGNSGVTGKSSFNSWWYWNTEAI